MDKTSRETITEDSKINECKTSNPDFRCRQTESYIE